MNQKQDPYISCLQETHFRPKDTYGLKVRGWKNMFHANGKQKNAGIGIVISEKNNIRIKEGHYKIIKGSTQEEEHNNCKYRCTKQENLYT